MLDQTRRQFLTRRGLIASGAILDPDFLALESGARAYFDLGAGRGEWTTLLFRQGDFLDIT